MSLGKIYIGIYFAESKAVAYAYMKDDMTGRTGEGQKRVDNELSHYSNWEQIDDYIYANDESDIWTYVENKYGTPQCCGWY